MTQQANSAATTASEAKNEAAAAGERVAEIAKTAGANAAARDRTAAYAVALGQLSDAVRAGRPFVAELKAATVLGGDAAGLAKLAALAETGAPSLPALSSAFEAASPAIIAALTPKDQALPADAGVADRLWASVGRVVSITREGEDAPAGPADAAGPVRAIADALQRGDLAGAIGLFEALPEPGRQAGAAWLTQARSTLDATDTARAETVAALQKLATE